VLFHVGRSVVVAREMARRGHHTVLAGAARYLCDPEVSSTAESRYTSLPDFSAEEGMELLRSIRRRPDRRLVEAMIEAEIELLGSLRPDLVVVDFRPTMNLSTRACGVPTASLLLGHWLPEYATKPGWVPRSYAAAALAERFLGERTTSALADPIFRAVIRYKTGPFRAAARARGQVAPQLLWDLIQGDLNLLTDVEALCPVRLPAGCHRVGPIVWEPSTSLPAWVGKLDRARPVLLVNFGSTGHPDLFRATFAALGDRPWQVVLATCGQIDAGDFDVPSNFFVEKYLPVGRMMEIADLVIYHGGAGTFQQLIRAGVAGVVIATHWDQEYAGVVSRERGIGPVLTMREVRSSPDRLRGAVDSVLADLPSYREHAREAREALDACDGAKAAAEHLEAFLAGRSGAAPLRSPEYPHAEERH
jgi:UDP:flavonoid glycosyltransferase YjiC (YdhE family)